MHWLITYSQKEKRQEEIIVNCPIQHIHPADWLLAMIKKYPDSNTILLFAIEITEDQFKRLDGEI